MEPVNPNLLKVIYQDIGPDVLPMNIGWFTRLLPIISLLLPAKITIDNFKHVKKPGSIAMFCKRTEHSIFGKQPLFNNMLLAWTNPV